MAPFPFDDRRARWLLAAAILATADDALAQRLVAWRTAQTEAVATEPA